MSRLVNPGHPIPPETSAIHHIIDEDVAHQAAWPVAALPIIAPLHLEGNWIKPEPIVAFAAHNAKFERQWITDDLTSGRPWICTYKCALRLWPDAPSHSNQTLRYWRKPPGLDREIANVAHRAGPDAYVSAHLLAQMLTEAPLDSLIQWTSEPALLIRCHIGKERGKLWSDVDSGFLRWLLDKDFDEDVKFTARHHLELKANAA